MFTYAERWQGECDLPFSDYEMREKTFDGGFPGVWLCIRFQDDDGDNVASVDGSLAEADNLPKNLIAMNHITCRDKLGPFWRACGLTKDKMPKTLAEIRAKLDTYAGNITVRGVVELQPSRNNPDKKFNVVTRFLDTATPDSVLSK